MSTKKKNKIKKYKIRDYFGYASKNNPTMLIMYYLSYPVVLFFEKINFKPNHVTFLSVIFSLLSLISLVYLKSIGLFALTFFISQLLDYSDGTLARKTNQISKNVINPDTISDLIKVFLVHFSLSIYFNDRLIWIISFVSLFLFLLYVIIEFLLENKDKRKVTKVILLRKKFRLIDQIYDLPLIGSIIKFIYRFCTTLQGQAVLVFIVAPFNYKICLYTFTYFIFVILFNLNKSLNKA